MSIALRICAESITASKRLFEQTETNPFTLMYQFLPTLLGRTQGATGNNRCWHPKVLEELGGTTLNVARLPSLEGIKE